MRVRDFMKTEVITVEPKTPIMEALDIMKKNSTIDITYLGAPKYRLSIKADDFKIAEKSLKPIIEEIQKNMEKKNGSFKFTREESKKTRDG